MKKLILTAILAVLALMVPAVRAQEDHPQIPSSDVAQKAKPFLGDWNSVVCEPKPYGVRFNIRLETTKDDAGKDVTTPIFKLLGVQVYPDIEPFDFSTLDFAAIPGQEQGKEFLLLEVSNGALTLDLLPVDGGVGLYGAVTDNTSGDQAHIFTETKNGNDDTYAYVAGLSKQVCQDQPDDKKSANNRVQVAFKQ